MAVEVEGAAGSGDAVALGIVRSAGEKLAAFVTAIRGTLWQNDEVVSASYIGGVFRSGAVLTAFTNALEAGGKLRVRAPVRGAAEGALIEAYRLAGRAIFLS